MRAALGYAERGWFVFPVHSIVDGKCSCGRVCGRPGKHPATQNGWKDASVTETDIRKWWSDHPNRNIGIACGPSKLLVLDIDPRNDGDATLADLLTRFGELPRTLTCLTGGGGQHYYFDVAGYDAKFRGRVLGQGVELQASGQYIVAPPSNHIRGVYQWDFGQESVPVLPPGWLVDEDSRIRNVATTVGAPLDTILGVAFSAAGMLGPALGADRAMVACPWEGDHSQGSRYDSSTIVFGAAGRGKWGYFYCSHAHCKERLAAFGDHQSRNTHIMEALPEKAADYAKKRIKGADRELRRVVRVEWERSLVWNDRGEKILPIAGNLKLMMDHLDGWAGSVAFDESTDRLYWTKDPPAVEGLPRPAAGAELQESDWIHCSQWFSKERRVEFRKEIASEVLATMGQSNRHNSLADYLNGLAWDGNPRISNWLREYAGAEDTASNRAIGRAWLISAIARALDPGCQVDHTLVLEGKQGIGKTSVFRLLGGKWYLGNLPRLEDKDAKHILSGSWLVEIQELAAIKGSMLEKVKSYLTERSDTYRPPYHRDFVRRPRRCVFGATTNEGEWNGDSTGARRFWPVRVGLVRTEELDRARDQLWAEARDCYLAGERFWFAPEAVELQAELRENQESRRVNDPWQEVVERHALKNDEIKLEAILSDLGIEPGKRTVFDSTRLARILASLGWVRRKVRDPLTGGRRWVYLRAAPAAPESTSETTPTPDQASET